MVKKAVIITWEGYQDSEVIYPYYRLLEDDFKVDIAAQKTGDIYGILGTKMKATIPIHDLKIEDYDLIILPGGVKAIEKVRQEKNVLDFIYEWNKIGKVIGSICHGAQLLISAKVTKGRKISGYYSIKDDIENSGATYIDAPYVTDENIISSPHYNYLGPWMKEVLRVFYMKNQN
ncbi:MAG: DJ-1/PfpI family protein [Candidatus Pacearchaeota archaeon]